MAPAPALNRQRRCRPDDPIRVEPLQQTSDRARIAVVQTGAFDWAELAADVTGRLLAVAVAEGRSGAGAAASGPLKHSVRNREGQRT